MIKTLANLTGWVTRREGRKFLRLGEATDISRLNGDSMDGAAGISLYVHIPFCRTLCPFCCFNRYLFREDAARRYFLQLRRELDMYIKRGFRFSSFYFGGGTPTIMMDELTAFIGYLRQQFDVKQISLETMPREVNEDTLRQLKGVGVNRLSIGVQSFDNGILKAMGRPQPPGEEIKDKLKLARGRFDTLNADFVFNFPGQTLEQFAADVAAFKEMGIDQATFYPLMASPHKKDALERKFNRVDTSQEKRFYDIIIRELYEQGYHASTAWCFSRGERMIDEYIVDDDDYIGIGAGSVSIVRGNFYVNSFALESYGRLVESGRLPIIGWRTLSPAEHRRYYLLTKLFGTKVDEASFRRVFDREIGAALRPEMAFFRLFGLVAGRGPIRVTTRGMYPVSTMMREFFASLNTLRERCIEQQV